jgi:fructose-1,6-bisphosphatase I
MINALKNSGVCSVLVSEENEDPIIVEPRRQQKFCIAFDPLNGSSNIDCNVSFGTIFSVFEKSTVSNVDDLLRSGAECVCAGYIMYVTYCTARLRIQFGCGDGVCFPRWR